jgi:hypothetical protein
MMRSRCSAAFSRLTLIMHLDHIKSAMRTAP